MAAPLLIITGPGGERQVELKSKGTLLGRNPKCDVVLEGERVSRKHARIFQDPFRRWIIHDLGSRNGVKLAGKRVDVHALMPGEPVELGPYTLTLAGEPANRVPADSSGTATTTTFSEAVPSKMTVAKPQDAALLSRARLKALNAIIDKLNSLGDVGRLYGEACRLVARAPGSAALVLRLEDEAGTLPQVLASHFASATGQPTGGDTGGFHVSRRVVEAARTEKTAVMAGGAGEAQAAIDLTVQDPVRPRRVICAPIGKPEGAFDVLYVDLSADQAATDTLEFVQAVAQQIHMAGRNLLLAEERLRNRVVDEQLEMARRIQARLTPTTVGPIAGLDVAVCYRPSLWVGGDYCDLWPLADGRLVFAVGDVAGKGMAAAMVMANLHAALRNTLLFCPEPAQAVAHVSGFLGQHLPDNIFVTLFVGLLSPGDGLLRYVNAGHMPPLLVCQGREVRPLGQPLNPPLGLGQDAWPGQYQAEEVHLAPREGLVAYTDGISEALSAQNEMFGAERIQAALSAARKESAQELVDLVVRTAEQFAHAGFQDDVTVLALQRQGA